jgi:hypothetical protein
MLTIVVGVLVGLVGLGSEVGYVDHNALLVGLILAAVVVVVALILGRRLEASIGSVHVELKPNGGSSFRDVVDARCDKLDRRITQLERLARDK